MTQRQKHDRGMLHSLDTIFVHKDLRKVNMSGRSRLSAFCRSLVAAPLLSKISVHVVNIQPR